MPALIEGQPVFMQGSGAKPYELKNVGGVYSCNCPAWRNQGVPIDKRTCKHLKKHCGDAAEMARIGASPLGNTPVFALNQGQNSGGASSSTQVPQSVVTGAVTNGQAYAVGIDGRGEFTADAGYAETVVQRALADGRKLRQDEKAKLFGPPVLLAHKFEDFDDLDPTGWWFSEKLDGVRAYWDGKNFISRQGNIFHAPDWFKSVLPQNEILDGELWMGRQMFQKTISVVKRHDWGSGAVNVKYVIFDMPSRQDTFEVRINEAVNFAKALNATHVMAHPHDVVQSRQHLLSELRKIESAGGEGLMIRKPGSLYEVGRSSTLLKVKPFKDDEGTVVAHQPGKGRHKGRLGSVTVQWNGVEFDLGTGFTDEDRRNPPPIGSLVTFRYTELTEDGKPKCSSFICVRDGH